MLPSLPARRVEQYRDRSGPLLPGRCAWPWWSCCPSLLLDLDELAGVVGPWRRAIGGDHAHQCSAAGEGAVAAVIQLSGILLVNEATIAAGRKRRAQASCG